MTFTPAEVAVLGLAAHVWQQAALAVPAARALAKLKAVGAADDPLLAAGAGRDLAGLVDPVVRTVEPAFSPLHDALRLRARGPVRLPPARAREPTRAHRRAVAPRPALGQLVPRRPRPGPRRRPGVPAQPDRGRR